MDRFVLTARLKPDGRRRALALLAEHSAFGMELETYLDRHTIFLTETEVIFLFEGKGAHEAVRESSTIQSSRRPSATGFRSSTDPFIKHKRRTPGAPRTRFSTDSSRTLRATLLQRGFDVHSKIGAASGHALS
jgi:hypothetical protein